MQIVGYETDRPALLLAAGGTVEAEPLEAGRRLEYGLGRRRCAGRIEDGRHTPCENDGVPYCERHSSRWACARCRGDCDRPLPACHEEHAVYLAAFGPATFKVGVTRSWRLERRLREQGADRGAKLRTVDDGRTARRIEADIATDVGDRVRMPTKVRSLHRPVDEDAWQALLASYEPVSTFSFDYGLELSGPPVAETVLTGTVRGTKGRLLVVEHRGTAYAVDLRGLVGYELAAGGTDRPLQSSLASFDG